MPSGSANLLTIPCELRNAIYHYVFDPTVTSSCAPMFPELSSSAAPALKFDNTVYVEAGYNNRRSSRRLDPLRTCRQIHDEAHLLALSFIPFHLSGDSSEPDRFGRRSQPLRPAKIGAIRHLTLTARISNLRALNEAWDGVPFGHPGLRLDTLTVVPRRPDASTSAYAEVADLSQCHTLAYIISETLKGLRNVKTVEVRNQGCFNDVVWRIVYRCLVYRMWRWGGGRCGVRFECNEEEQQHADEVAWFRVHLEEPEDGQLVGTEVGDEVMRLAGMIGRLPDPDEAGMEP